jgi:hypothetical protein
LQPSQVPVTCTSSTNWKSSSDIFGIVASRVMPALLTITSSEPNCSTVQSTSAVTSDSLVTLQRTANARPSPSCRGPRRRALVQVGDDDSGALVGEPRGDREADALRRAGDNGDLLLQQLAHQ